MKRHPFVRAFQDRLTSALRHYRHLVHFHGPAHPKTCAARANIKAWLAVYA